MEVRQRLRHQHLKFLSIATELSAQVGQRKIPSIFDSLQTDRFHIGQLTTWKRGRALTKTLKSLSAELALRDAMGSGEVPSDIDRLETPGNFAFGLWIGDGAPRKRRYFGASPRALKLISNWATAPKDEREAQFKSKGTRHSEYVILNKVARIHKKTASGTFFLFTERLPCDECEKVIQQFLEHFTNVRLSVAYLTEGPRDAKDGRVKQIQARLRRHGKGHRLYRLNASQLANPGARR
ncbi:hypothetical protein PAN31108_00023 [Pandoraea anhela]|uniref:Uncharacterized protein n=2 Tax=Pandoraea anhela TaxID=2508295 RepID=A0A5E4R854_9BURK|nr:hypothetical protein PAN31108_00023 [Pandoraea anhela]